LNLRLHSKLPRSIDKLLPALTSHVGVHAYAKSWLRSAYLGLPRWRLGGGVANSTAQSQVVHIVMRSRPATRRFQLRQPGRGQVQVQRGGGGPLRLRLGMAVRKGRRLPVHQLHPQPGAAARPVMAGIMLAHSNERARRPHQHSRCIAKKSPLCGDSPAAVAESQHAGTCSLRRTTRCRQPLCRSRPPRSWGWTCGSTPTTSSARLRCVNKLRILIKFAESGREFLSGKHLIAFPRYQNRRPGELFTLIHFPFAAFALFVFCSFVCSIPEESLITSPPYWHNTCPHAHAEYIAAFWNVSLFRR